MRIFDLVFMGLRNLKRRKARTALTVIGVVIGTISIIVMVSLGIGLDKSYERQLLSAGNLRSLTVQGWVYKDDGDGNYTEIDNTKLMNDEMIETLSKLDHVKAVTPKIMPNIKFRGNGWVTQWTSGYAIRFSSIPDMDFPKLEEGEYDIRDGSEQIILGKNALEGRVNPRNGKPVEGEIDFSKERIFYSYNTGEEEMEQSVPMEIISDEGSSAGSDEGGQSEGEPTPGQPEQRKKKVKKTLLSNYVVMPETEDYEMVQYYYIDFTYYKKLCEEYAKTLPSTERKQFLKNSSIYDSICVIVDDVNNVEEVTKSIEDLGLNCWGPGSWASQVKDHAKTISLILGGIGAISMIVSAISIANTMIMSIYERTKEIGVMKVLGCVVTDIKKLFLLEAGIIGFIGGLVGVGISYVLSYCLNHYGGKVFGEALGMVAEEGQDVTMSVIPIWLSLAALGFAFLVGVVSGYYPARRATKISAIEAMKTEG